MDRQNIPSSFEAQLFKDESRTYYTASRFFPKRIRGDVVKLYSFVRVADNYVDAVPQKSAEFRGLEAKWRWLKDKPISQLAPRPDDTLNERVVKNMCRMCILYHIEHKWVEAFLHSMRQDLNPPVYQKIEDTLDYMYGSAEAVGLMMARVLGLPNEALPAAAMQGRAMQYVNFLRDINEDHLHDRHYFPKQELNTHGLKDLSQTSAYAKPEAFKAFMREQLGRYYQWQAEADKGMHYIPRRPRMAIRTAADGYYWTARKIARDPFIVYRKKVKPTKRRLILNGLSHLFD